MAEAPWIRELSKIVGSDKVTSDAAAFACQGVAPAAVCIPTDAVDAAKVLAFAAQHGIAVLPSGGGTGQGIGYAPPAGSLAVFTKRLNQGFAHEPADIIATIPAGMELGDAQARLQKNGQWLPLDGEAKSTLGGLIATDRSGPLSYGYGTLRDMVIGMTVINGDGVLRKCGGKVVKNVTGYALDKLYIGSMGTLGLIVEVTFKLRPLPIARHGWDVALADLERGVAALRAVGRKNLPLETLHLQYAKGGTYTLRITAAGTELELDRIHAEVSASCSASEGTTVERRTLSTAWQPAEAPAGRSLAVGAATLRFWSVPSKLDAALAVIAPLADSFDVHTQGGVALIACSAVQAAELAAKLAALGANLRFENLRGISVKERFGPPRADWALMANLRASLDPKGIMNPGRFVV
jgi:glycolate oxidase FAD binding subunit